MAKLAFIMGNFVPPFLHGTNIVIRKLMKNIDYEAMIFSLTPYPKDLFRLKEIDGFRVFYFSLNRKIHFSTYIWDNLYSRILASYLRKFNTDIVIGVFPSLQSLKFGFKAGKIVNLPFIAYLHDTIFERRKINEKNILNEACKVVVISKGLKDFYDKKYTLNADVVPHIYDGPIFNAIDDSLENRVVFIGDVYEINDKSLIRLFKVLNNISSLPIYVTSENAYNIFNKAGVKNIKHKFFSKYADLISFIRKSKLLIIALNWPDETTIPYDELRTIFPTKSIDYLAVGGNIVIHAPNDYFVSKFFKENQCGIIIDSKNEKDIVRVLKDTLNKSNKKMRKQSLKVVNSFYADKVKNKFQDIIQTCLLN